MKPFENFLGAIIVEKASSRTVVGLVAMINIVGSTIILYGLIGNPYYEKVLNIRIVHIVLSVSILLAMALLRKRWKNIYGSIFYTALYFPIFLTGWFNHVALVESGQLGKPFGGFPVVFMMLAVLVPYSYILNLILLTLFTLETLIIWFVLDLGSISNVAGNGEPFYIITFAFVCYCLLTVRYRLDSKIIRLTEQKARAEFIENLARTFLSMRDRNNTPLQTLLILSGTVKKDRALTQDQIDAFRNSVHSLISGNKSLIRYESQIQWGKRDLMTDNELENWLDQIEVEAGKDKR